MRQVTHPLPAGVLTCQPGHRPQLVQTLGGPPGHRIGTPAIPQWHVECHPCGRCTVPHAHRDVAVMRWRGEAALAHIPLAQLANVRSRVAITPTAA